MAARGQKGKGGGSDDGRRVRVTESADGIQITIRSSKLNFDPRLIEECVNSAIACAETNACLAEGLRLTDKCALTLVGHQLQDQCITAGFGFANTKRG